MSNSAVITISTTDEMRDLRNGTRVTVEGEVVDLKVEHLDRSWDHRDVGVIEINTGQETIRVMQRATKFAYGDGVLENWPDTRVFKGETIRLVASVDSHQALDAGDNQPYLLVPTPIRQDRYQRLRDWVSGQLQQVASTVAEKGFNQARTQFAHLRQQALTNWESDLLIALIRKLPEDQQPVFHERVHADALLTAFDRDVETYNTAEFLDFARGVLTGNVRKRHDASEWSQNHLFAYLDEPQFSPQELTDIAIIAIDVSLGQIQDDPDWFEKGFGAAASTLQNAIACLGGVDVIDAYVKLSGLAERFIAYGLFQDENEPYSPEKFRYMKILNKIFDALLETFRVNIDIADRARQTVNNWNQRLTEQQAEESTLKNLHRLIPFHPDAVR